ncbi:hypothetical protein DPSP01_006245 [Paraphaeosphaeria sporulosa]|uniref:Uncharacterized protein n=1 Tax=Paraphaeosphaeria sporulosa TaxID=1460663 RepID=A0A177BZF7_9PLEO|nr:uncharacterized protein CC84DRAFT_1168880 [Paraphaeosphaeria sporulosa]OAF99971.1 hypothetical protein CC84DRAFT_1168880 [Paraphaeosphaeria sporulosa]
MSPQHASTHGVSDADVNVYDPQPRPESQEERTGEGFAEQESVDERDAIAQDARSEHDGNRERQLTQEEQGKDGGQAPKKRGLFSKRKGGTKHRDATPLSNLSTSGHRDGLPSNPFSVTVANSFTTFPPPPRVAQHATRMEQRRAHRECDAERAPSMKLDGSKGPGHGQNLVQRAISIAEWEDDGKEDHIAGSRHFHDVQRHPAARRLNAIGRDMFEGGNGHIDAQFSRISPEYAAQIAVNRARLDRIY